jgi:hypothetical protein
MSHGEHVRIGGIVRDMAVTHYLLAHLLTVAGLIGGTIEYCEIIQRRAAQRRLEADRLVAHEAGLRGMVRVFLAER